MSKVVQTLANAQKGTAIRKAGFKTGIHADPEIKQWVDEKLSEGGHNLSSIQKDGVNKFGKERFVSLPALSNYEKRYFNDAKEIAPLYFQYNKDLIEYDAYKNLVELAQIHLDRYTEFKKREKQLNIPMSQIQKELLMYKDCLVKLIDIEIKIGVRQGTLSNTINFNDNSVKSNITIGSNDDEIENALEDVNGILRLQTRLSDYRDRGTARGRDFIEAETVSESEPNSV